MFQQSEKKSIFSILWRLQSRRTNEEKSARCASQRANARTLADERANVNERQPHRSAARARSPSAQPERTLSNYAKRRARESSTNKRASSLLVFCRTHTNFILTCRRAVAQSRKNQCERKVRSIRAQIFLRFVNTPSS